MNRNSIGALVLVMAAAGASSAQDHVTGTGDTTVTESIRVKTIPSGTRVESTESTAVNEELRDLATIDGVELGLVSNPEILAVRAEIQAAQARLKQLEMKTATEIVRKKSEIEELSKKVEAHRRLVEKQFAPPEELVPLEAELEAKKAELTYITGRPVRIVPGKGPVALYLSSDDRPLIASVGELQNVQVGAPLVLGSASSRPSLEEGVTGNLASLLDNVVTLHFEDTRLQEVIEFISETFEINTNLDVTVREINVDISLRDVALKHAFEALTDTYDLVFVLRDYGLFVTTHDRAMRVAGATIPEGVPFLGSAAGRMKLFGDAPVLGELNKGKFEADDRLIRGKEKRIMYDKVEPSERREVELRRFEEPGTVDVIPPREADPEPTPESPGNP